MVRALGWFAVHHDGNRKMVRAAAGGLTAASYKPVRLTDGTPSPQSRADSTHSGGRLRGLKRSVQVT